MVWDGLFHALTWVSTAIAILAERSLVAFQYRLLDVLSSKVDERYRNFVKKYATLIRGLSQKQIAGYIGASPEFLSKIKNQIKPIQ